MQMPVFAFVSLGKKIETTAIFVPRMTGADFRPIRFNAIVIITKTTVEGVVCTS